MSKKDTLTVKQRKAIAALLAEPSVIAAAKRAGISRKTLYRYLADPAFQQALAEAQSETLRLVVARLSGLLDKALDVIGLGLERGVDERLRLRAAGLVLGHFAGLLEYINLEERVSALEQKASEVKNGKS